MSIQYVKLDTLLTEEQLSALNCGVGHETWEDKIVIPELKQQGYTIRVEGFRVVKESPELVRGVHGTKNGQTFMFWYE